MVCSKLFVPYLSWLGQSSASLSKLSKALSHASIYILLFP